MAQILTNAFHLAAKQKHTFKDVPNPFWAENAISAVQSNGIADGTGNGNFEPYGTVTREQYAQFLYKTLKYKNADVKDTGDAALLTAFKEEVQKRINTYETNITLPYKTKNNNTNEVMNTLLTHIKKLQVKMSIQIIIDRMFHMDFLDHLEIIHLRLRLHIVKRKNRRNMS